MFSIVNHKLRSFSFFQNSNFKAVWVNPSEHILKWLSRGHLNITVILNTAGQLTQLTGHIGIKRTCNCELVKCS